MNILVNAVALDFVKPRGIANYTIGIVRGIAEHVDHIYFYIQSASKDALSKEFSDCGNVHVFDVPDLLPSKWLDVEKPPPWFRFLRRSRVAVLKAYGLKKLKRFHAQTALDAVFNPVHLRPFSKLLDLPALSTVHRILDDYSPALRHAAESHLQNADAVVCCWPIPYKELTRLAPEQAGKVAQIPYLADHLLGKPDMSVCNKHGLPQRFFFYPAAVLPRKNHAGLIQAYAQLKDEGVDVPTLVCSGGFLDRGFEKEMKEMVERQGLSDAVRFIGHVSNAEMAGLYAQCTAAVSSSFNEAGMAAIQEGGFLGRPVICSNTPEAVAQAALYDWDVPMFDPHDPADIATTIKRFLANEEQFQQDATRAAEKIRRYSSSYIGKCYAELFAWICGQGGKPAWYPIG